MEAVKEPLMLLDIEKELAGPDSHAALAQYDAVLMALGRRLEAVLKAGLPPEDYPRAEALKDANIIARKILRLAARVDGKARSA